MIVVATDFENGKFKAAFNEDTVLDLTACIERYEDRLMSELLGVELFALYTLGVIAVDPIYTKIQLQFIEQDTWSNLLVSNGVKDMLQGFIWCEYQREIYSQTTTFGSVKNKGENSDNVSFPASMYQIKYLESLTTYDAIQQYILENEAIYPTFKGLRKYPILPI